MPPDQYMVRVSVDGEPFPDGAICGGVYKHYHCSFYVSYQQKQHLSISSELTNFLTRLKISFCDSAQTVWYRTPTIQSVSPVSGLPGTALYR